MLARVDRGRVRLFTSGGHDWVIPEQSVDPLFHDKAYLIAPDKRGGKPYSLLQQAMRESGAARWLNGPIRARRASSRYGPQTTGWCSSKLLFADEARERATHRAGRRERLCTWTQRLRWRQTFAAGWVNPVSSAHMFAVSCSLRLVRRTKHLTNSGSRQHVAHTRRRSTASQHTYD